MNTTDFLNIANAICPDKVAIIFEGKRYTFCQLNERANRLASSLARLGVTRGDRLAILQVSCNESVETYFAAAKLGTIYLPLNFRARGEELSYMINHAEARTLIVGKRYCELIDSIKPGLKSVEHFVSLEAGHSGMLTYDDLIESGSPEEVETDIGDNDTTILMYTSGTTGFPKAVMLSHSSFVVYLLENVTPAEPDTEERNILSVPFYHIAGIQAMMAAVYGGRTMVIERQFEAREWLALVQAEKCHRAMMVPTMLKQVIEHPDFGSCDLSCLKVITYGAAPMPLEVIKRAVEVFPGVSFINAFGQTETASTITMVGPEDHVIEGSPEEREKKLRRLASIGRPLPDVEMRIFDEQGQELPAGQVGEIVVRGPRVMTGYWKDQEKTEATIDRAGWVHTGDMGYVDEDGYFFLTGRTTDMIKRGGEKISPEEIEAVLQTHPSVADVAVIGVPDAEWGEQPRAIIVPKEGMTASPEEIMEYCRTRIASFKRPRSVVFVDALPRNPMGKIIKRELRAKYGSP